MAGSNEDQAGPQQEGPTPGYETVHHPPHYNQHPSGVECIDIAEAFNFNVGNAIKYLWRAGLKPGVDGISDLRKALWYLKREVDRVSPTGTPEQWDIPTPLKMRCTAQVGQARCRFGAGHAGFHDIGPIPGDMFLR